jgi:hypothetical protein
MVPKEGMVAELESQGIDVSDVEEQIRHIAQDITAAARDQVIVQQGFQSKSFTGCAWIFPC